mgnify:CR=1 FL=1
MPVSSTLRRSTVALKLNAGKNPKTGSTMVKSCSLSGIRGGADPEAIVNVAELVTRVERTEVRTLERQ